MTGPKPLPIWSGQDAMPATLRNAFAADRIAQAFILTAIPLATERQPRRGLLPRG